MGAGKAAVGDLLAVAVADAHGDGSFGSQLVHMRVGGGGGIHVQRPVEQGDSLVDDDVGGVLGLDCAVEPAHSILLAREGRERPHGGDARERQGGGLCVRLGLARAPPSPRWGRRRPQRQHHQHALASLPAREVAAVRQRQGAGEVELGESE
jgi:hypothetical protein